VFDDAVEIAHILEQFTDVTQCRCDVGRVVVGQDESANWSNVPWLVQALLTPTQRIVARFFLRFCRQFVVERAERSDGREQRAVA
jgi:hypothetical protein